MHVIRFGTMSSEGVKSCRAERMGQAREKGWHWACEIHPGQVQRPAPGAD